ncbi:acyl-CoA-binding domain-containing protein 6-like isoform X1 [Nymphaea colorata]|nr:acyl-CoA-binding domain-containing protein 6-like isoform X1 [Nymphaea colorata]XP_031493376.1 acyl-CoA-binding domain-containing protein 6-like isoform X1 [Nymphaea colorata]
MRWESVKVVMRSKENLEEKKSLGMKSDTLGPGKRWGHTCNSIKGGRFLYVFGGYAKDNCQTNDVYVFDTVLVVFPAVKQAWSKPVMKGIPPSPRDSHSCTTVGTDLYIFGGTDGKNPLKDLHVLDTTTNTWTQPTVSGNGPEAREGHSAALVGKRLFLFGGCGKSRVEHEEVYYNDLYILDVESFVWKRVLTTGIPPSARDSHTCSSWKNKIIVIGGEDASDYYLSDVHVLDTDTLVWRELNTSGQILPPRAGHSTVALGKYLFVFGGFTDDRNLYDDLHVLNIDTCIWSKILSTSQAPSARFSVAGDCLDPQKGVLVFIGGCNENLEALDDMYYLHTDISIGHGKYDHRQEKLSLRKELKRKQREQYLNSAKWVPEIDKALHTSFSSLKHEQTGAENCSLYKSDTGETTFEATITDVLHYGYKIETNIGGKPLRGILFSYSPSLNFSHHAHVSRKRISKARDAAEGRDSSRQKEFDGAIGKREFLGVPNVNESTMQESALENLPSLSNGSSPTISHSNLIHENSEPDFVLQPAQEPQTSAAAKEAPSTNCVLPEGETISTSSKQGLC